MELRADNDGMIIRGPVRVGNVSATGAYSQRFGPEGRGKSDIAADITLSQQFLDEFKITLPPGSVTGQGQARIDVALRKGQAPAFTLQSDLRGIGIGLPQIGWRKPQGSAGELTVAGTLGPVANITQLDISGGGLDARGAVFLNADGTLESVTFRQVRLADWLNAPITLRGRGRGRSVGVSIGAGEIDLRRAQFGPSQGDGGPMSLALDRLQVTQGIALTQFRGDFDGAGGFSGQFTARLNGEVPIRGTVVPRNGQSAVRIVSDDGGGALRAAGFLRNATGGTLDLTLSPTRAAGTFDGQLAMRALRLRDAPAMAAILDAISVVGLLQQLDGQGLAFDEVEANFRLTPQQVIVTQSSAVGPGLGISLDGIYTLANKSVDFQGVVSPFYLINSIGLVLTRKGEGLIGINFTATGAVDAPRVSVNPLSALTPGMFREIFRRPAPQVSE